MEIRSVDPWRLYLHERPLKKNLEFFLRDPEKITEFPIAAVEYNGKLVVIDGTHRVVAARNVGIKKINAIVFSYDEYCKLFEIRKWYGFCNRGINKWELMPGSDYVVEERDRNSWKHLMDISRDCFEELLRILVFDIKGNLNKAKFRIYLKHNLKHSDIVENAIKGNLYPPKTTAHFVKVWKRRHHVEELEKDPNVRLEVQKYLAGSPMRIYKDKRGKKGFFKGERYYKKGY